MASNGNPDKLNRSDEAGSNRYIRFVRPQECLIPDIEEEHLPEEVSG